MTTDSRGDISPFDFEELANLLIEQGQAASPADLHGCVYGMLASGASHQAEAGIAGLSPALDPDVDDVARDEESERNYAELAEYIRFAALNACAGGVLTT